MCRGLRIHSHTAEGITVLEVRLEGLCDGNMVYDLVMLRDRLLNQEDADVIIDASNALVMPGAPEGVLISLGRELAQRGKMLHYVVGNDNRPSMADLTTKYRGISFHKTLTSALESAGAVTVAA